MGSHSRLEISPSGIIAVHRGSRTFIPVDPAAWEDTQKANFAPLMAPVAQAVAQAGLKGKHVQVVYESRESAVEMLTLPLASKEANAAAGLRVRESLGGSTILSQVTAARVPSGKSSASTTLLLAGERTRMVEAIAGLVKAAGAVPNSLVPAKAVAMRSAIASILGASVARTNVVLWLDRHCSSLAGGTGGLCSFARLLGGGYDLIVDAFRRAARDTGGLDFESASEMLLRYGMPRRGQTMGEAVKLDSDRVLPLLQPALQRFAVEIKQTMRFGLPEGESSRAELILAGPGAAIPGLADTLSTLIETSVRVQNAEADHARERIQAVMPLGMTPAATDARRARHRLMAAAAAGAIFAGAAIAADLSWSKSEVERLRTIVAENERQLEVVRTKVAARDKLDSLSETLGKLDTLAEATVGSAPSWAAGIALASRLGIPGLEVHELTGLSASDGPTLIIKGILPAPEGQPNPVSALLEKLNASPLASQVRIGSSRLVESHGSRAVHFSVTVFLAPLNPGDIVRVSEAHNGVQP